MRRAPLAHDVQGRTRRQPSVFIIDRAGVVRFAHTNPDFTVRLSGEDVLAAAEAAR